MDPERIDWLIREPSFTTWRGTCEFSKFVHSQTQYRISITAERKSPALLLLIQPAGEAGGLPVETLADN